MEKKNKKLYAYRLNLMRKRLYLLNDLLEEDAYEKEEKRLAAFEAFQEATALADKIGAMILDAHNATVKTFSYNMNRLKELDVLPYDVKEKLEKADGLSEEITEDVDTLDTQTLRRSLRDVLPALLSAASNFEHWIMEKLRRDESINTAED